MAGSSGGQQLPQDNKPKKKKLTHELSKYPGFGVLHHFDEDGGHGDAEYEDVGQAQVEQEEVGGIAQVSVVPDDDGHEAIAHQADDQYQSARQSHQQGHVGRNGLVVRHRRRRHVDQLVPSLVHPRRRPSGCHPRGIRRQRRHQPIQFGGHHS